MKKKEIKTNSQAIDYLRHVSLNWGESEWGKHHRQLVQSIRIILNQYENTKEKLNDKRINKVKAVQSRERTHTRAGRKGNGDSQKYNRLHRIFGKLHY